MKTEELYYIQDTRSYLGNAIVWWGKNGGGYTADIERAGKYTKEEAKSICQRDTDRAWPCSYIDSLQRIQIIDSQFTDCKHSRTWKRKTKPKRVVYSKTVTDDQDLPF